MLCAIDIGNTHTVVGIFDGDQIKSTFRLLSNREHTTDQYSAELLSLIHFQTKVEPTTIKNCVISSTVPVLSLVYQQVSRKIFKVEPLIITSDTVPMLKNDYDRPHEVGPDRLVNAVASMTYYGAPIIVLDFGTATTLDVITAPNCYIGGMIAPGLKIGLDALRQKTALLPTITLSPPLNCIGRNTIDSMRSGVFFGYCSLVDGLIERIWDELKYPTETVMTGGLSNLFLGHLKTVKNIDQHLTLKGLQLIYKHNSFDLC